MAYKLTDGRSDYRADKSPDTCPWCHMACQPIPTNDARLTTSKNGYFRLQAVFQCPRNECGVLFIAEYFAEKPELGDRTPVSFEYISTWPKGFVQLKFSAEIENVSPDFCKIYNEAANAESIELNSICGPGYRKALEFLIKDYLISKASSEADKSAIKRKLLGACIQDHIDHAQLKEVAKRAAWLGNDETHYERKWEDKDITDLKDVIKLCVSWVEMHVRTDNLMISMPTGR